MHATEMERAQMEQTGGVAAAGADDEWDTNGGEI